MIDPCYQVPQPLPIQARLCSFGDGQVQLSTGYVCLSFSYAEFLQLAQVVHDVALQVSEQVVVWEQRTEVPARHEISPADRAQPHDSATRLAWVICQLRTETEPTRIAELHRLAAELDEQVRQEVRQYARERAAVLGTKET